MLFEVINKYIMYCRQVTSIRNLEDYAFYLVYTNEYGRDGVFVLHDDPVFVIVCPD